MKEIHDQLHIKGKNLNILYVEDDIDTLDMMSLFLGNIFKNVDKAQNGEDALNQYKKKYETTNQYYDIVMSDLTMPKVDGLDLTKEIFKINKDQVIIIVSANDNFESIIELINLGINYFVKKPIVSTNFQSVLEKALRFIDNEKQLALKTKELENLNHTLEEQVLLQNQSLYQRLYYNELTLLPKRNKLIEDINKLSPKELHLININEFKNINSVYGYDIGDMVLIEFSRVLMEIAFKRGYTIYHTGGDEFILVSFEAVDTNYTKETAKSIIEIIEEKNIDIFYNKEIINISLNITIGITTTQLHMLNNAKLALQYATTNRLPYFIYDKELKLEDDSSNEIEHVKLIKKAIKENLIVPFFQPIFYGDGKIKYETLVRIVDGDNTYLPFYFLPTAKKIRLYKEFTKIIIQKSFEIFEKKDNEFSINLSFEDIVDNDTMEYLYEMIQKYHVHNKIVIELLESENIEDFNIVKSFIEKVKALGVKISIDDFGSGYSNFSYLIQLKPDFIKIDGSIVKKIDKDENSFAITKNIVEFAKKLGAKTIAEYVHSKEVYEKAKEIGVDAFQGFYLGKPQLLTN